MFDSLTLELFFAVSLFSLACLFMLGHLAYLFLGKGSLFENNRTIVEWYKQSGVIKHTVTVLLGIGILGLVFALYRTGSVSYLGQIISPLGASGVPLINAEHLVQSVNKNKGSNNNDSYGHYGNNFHGTTTIVNGEQVHVSPMIFIPEDFEGLEERVQEQNIEYSAIAITPEIADFYLEHCFNHTEYPNGYISHDKQTLYTSLTTDGWFYMRELDIMHGQFLSLMCYLGAYQSADLLLYADPEKQTGGTIRYTDLIEFTEPPEVVESYAQDLRGESDDTFLKYITTNLDYSEKTGKFTTFSKGRGLGDCGSAATYTWDSENKELVLRTYHWKPECDGQYDEWPQIYHL